VRTSTLPPGAITTTGPTQTLPIPTALPVIPLPSQRKATLVNNVKGTLIFGLGSPYVLYGPEGTGDEGEKPHYNIAGFNNMSQVENRNSQYQSNGLLPPVADAIKALCDDLVASGMVPDNQEGNCVSLSGNLKQFVSQEKVIGFRYGALLFVVCPPPLLTRLSMVIGFRYGALRFVVCPPPLLTRLSMVIGFRYGAVCLDRILHSRVVYCYIGSHTYWLQANIRVANS
jgi:hypothetical protein